MKKSSKNKLGWLAVILVFGILFYFGFLQSTMPSSSIVLYGKSISPVNGEFDFLGNKATYETTWLGSIASGDVLDTTQYGIVKSGTRTTYPVEINSINDAGKISLSNSYSVSGDSITLTSSSGGVNPVDTHISTTINVSRGTITISCTNKLTSTYGEMLNYGCGVDGKKELTRQYQYGTPKGIEQSETQTVTVNVEGLTTLYTSISTSSKDYGSTTATFTYSPEKKYLTMPVTGQITSPTTQTPTTKTTTTSPNVVSNTQNPSVESPQSTISPLGWIIIALVGGLIIVIIYRRFSK